MLILRCNKALFLQIDGVEVANFEVNALFFRSSSRKAGCDWPKTMTAILKDALKSIIGPTLKSLFSWDSRLIDFKEKEYHLAGLN